MPRNSAAYLWSRKLAKPVEAFPAKKCLAAPRAEGPKAWIQSGAEQGTQKPKKPLPRLGEEVVAWGQGGEATKTATEASRKGQRTKLRAFLCGCDQIRVKVALLALLILMRFLS